MQNIQPDNLIKIKKLKKQLTAAVVILFILVIGFLAVYDLKPGQEALAITGNYNKNSGDQLTTNDWKNLPNDFVDASGDKMTGSLGVNLLSKDSVGHELVVKDTSGGPGVYIWGYNKNAELALGSGSSYWAIYSDETNTDDLRFWRGGNNMMVITDGGNVGIGTDKPLSEAKLHIIGGNLYVMNDGKTPFILVGDSGTDYGLLKWDSVNDKLYLGTHANAKDKTIVIEESGEVGIGTDDPQATLDVGGDIKTSGSIKYKDLSDFRLVYRDDFETGSDGWTGEGASVTTCGSANIFGPADPDKLNSSIKKDYSLTKISHKEIKVVLDYYSIDSWDNEWGCVMVDGSNVNKVWCQQFSEDQFGRTDICGTKNWKEAVYRAELSGTHTGDTVTVTANAKLNDKTDNERFGIDNVEIWVR